MEQYSVVAHQPGRWVGLVDILPVFANVGGEWLIAEFEATGMFPNETGPAFERRVLKSEYGLSVSFAELTEISHYPSDLMQCIIVGFKRRRPSSIEFLRKHRFAVDFILLDLRGHRLSDGVFGDADPKQLGESLEAEIDFGVSRVDSGSWTVFFRKELESELDLERLREIGGERASLAGER